MSVPFEAIACPPPPSTLAAYPSGSGRGPAVVVEMTMVPVGGPQVISNRDRAASVPTATSAGILPADRTVRRNPCQADLWSPAVTPANVTVPLLPIA